MSKKAKGHWEHRGSYSVVITDDANTHHLPGGALVRGNLVTVQSGRLKQLKSGVQFYANEQPFFWSYAFIKEIRDGNGDLVWERRGP